MNLTDGPENLARALRLRTSLPIQCDTGDGPAASRLLDLSLSGAFLEHEFPPSQGMPLTLTLPIPDGEPPLQIAGKVTRNGVALKAIPARALEYLCVRVYGMGVRFDSIEASAKERLEKYLREVATQ